MNELTIEKYIITYSNYLEFEGRKLAFRRKELFDITNLPFYIPRTTQGYWIGRKLLSPKTAESLIKRESIKVDVSSMQWYQQEELNEVFNLK